MMRRTSTWLLGLVRHRTAQSGAVVATIAVTVALLAILGGFFSAAESSMTGKAIADVPVDWQVQLGSGVSPDDVRAALPSQPGPAAVAAVGYFATPGFQATTGTTVQTTGAGFVLGIDPGYETMFPDEIRHLIGDGTTVLAQQTAANLNATIGTSVSILRPGMEPASVTVDGVVDLPYADSLFQSVGAPSGATPQAPPDNVLLMPLDQWHALFDPVAASTAAPQSVVNQVHVALDTSGLPHSPTDAFTAVTRKAHNVESRMAGGAIVGNNLGARLDAARSDALYARVLFLFLGLPGVILSILLTVNVVAMGTLRRQRDQALLRLRGCSLPQVLGLACAEALLAGIVGGALGVIAAAVALRTIYRDQAVAFETSRFLLWMGIAVSVGIATAVVTIGLSAWRAYRSISVAGSRASMHRPGRSFPVFFGLDLVALGLSALIYWQAGRNGYQVVLAPEGLASVSVSYSTFLAPLFLWVGASLLVMRVARWLLAHQGGLPRPVVRAFSGRLAPLVSSSLSLQRARIATGIVLIVIAVAFALSTSIFNATYQRQAVVDAELSNGSDVTMSGSTGAGSDLSSWQSPVGQVPGVAAVVPMQHRFAYVGTDLQDMYGIDPGTLDQAARISDTFFVGDNAETVLQRLAATPDGVLISPETVTDFQLQVGDAINLRMQLKADGQYHTVPFHVVGVAREFPTAPSDSFLVANASYLATATGSASIETLLLKTNDPPAAVAGRIREQIGPASGIHVRDINEQRHIINSGLTSISLNGLTRVELVFAVIMAAAGAGLMLFVGLESVQRTVAVSRALGATPRQLGSFIWSEAGVLVIGGLTGGVALGWMIAAMLANLLTGVFDPPPAAMTIPWSYIALVLLVTVGSVAAAARTTIGLSQRRILETIRQF